MRTLGLATKSGVDASDVVIQRELPGVGADADVNLGRRWYLSLSGIHQSGVLQANDQVFGGLSYRF